MNLTSTSKNIYDGSMPQPAGELFENPTIVVPSTPVSFAQSSIPSSGISAQSVLGIVKLVSVYSALFFAPILSAYAIQSRSSAPSVLAETQNEIVSPVTNATNTGQVTLASTGGAQQLEYELSLANGFLKKAIELSNATTNQTAQEKQEIVSLLNQALEAANRAVASAPTDSRGYTVRGRIYQATSVIKPEMKTLADADFAKAAELGSPNPTQAPETQNPVELLPTEQAQGTNTAMIAGPQETTTEEVSGETSQNANKQTVTLEAGQTELFIPYTQVQDTTQLYVTANNNTENVVTYVKNKQAGNGFTIAATQAPTAPLELTWWEIQ